MTRAVDSLISAQRCMTVRSGQDGIDTAAKRRENNNNSNSSSNNNSNNSNNSTIGSGGMRLRNPAGIDPETGNPKVSDPAKPEMETEYHCDNINNNNNNNNNNKESESK